MAVDYCTASDVEENLKKIDIDADTAVTPTSLGNFITEESAVIDAHIQSRYALPVLDQTALVFLKRICVTLCVYRVTKVLQTKNARPAPNGLIIQDISDIGAYKEAMRMLKDLASGKMQLPEEAKKSQTMTNSTAVNNDKKFTFEHGTDQW